MNIETAIPSLDNPVFHTYMIAASIMILKLMFQPWIRCQRWDDCRRALIVMSGVFSALHR
ncbi:MAG: hypothetical protein E2O53_10060 [Gammaproteobacteria bacterium]|nr:MAG: hypothetical protein E2O53_10060 [Gammaproteobacteria bacterium]